tara:strand:- start:1778 stop:2275 length:498 start_codon:yes stop_codon:yes gene_type:complete
MLPIIKENFLTMDECDFIASYYKEHSEKYVLSSDSTYIRFLDIPFYHFRMRSLIKKFIRNIEKDFSFLMFNYGQIVHWSVGSYLNLHKDVDIPSSNSVGSGVVDWTGVCYLNDNFDGGQTVIGDDKIEAKKGRLLLFNSKKILHGVNKVCGNRYTIIAWFEEIKK